MKKTLTINLAGQVYHIDEDAYAKLKNYLDSLKKVFRKETNSQEILDDFEARIAELLNDRKNNNQIVVTINDVNTIIETLGDPNSILGNEEPESHQAKFKTRPSSRRRMYRDPDSRLIGGVASGLAAYWRVDPSLVRIAFVIIALLGLSGVLIYLILWVILPEAHTAAEKLEMRGEAVTMESVKEFFKEEFENVKRNFQK